MKKAKSRDPVSKSYRRSPPKILLRGNTFLIVTEGKKTEPNYLKALCQRLRLNVTEVEVANSDVRLDHPDGTDPITLVNKAIKLKEDRKREAKKGLVVEYDEVWVVYDLEKTHDRRRELSRRAEELKGAEAIKFATSDPCFEYWLLLHETYTARLFSGCDAVTKLLLDHVKTYGKGWKPPSDFIEKLPSAIVHAERCRKNHEATGGDGNPSTEVDKLALSLNPATREHLQFSLP